MTEDDQARVRAKQQWADAASRLESGEHPPAMSADALYDVLHAASPTDEVLVRTPGGGVWVPTRVYRTEQGTFVIMCAEDMTDDDEG